MRLNFKYILIGALFALSLSACSDREREQKLQDREKAVSIKEQELKIWEQRLRLKEAELEKLAKDDSLRSDTAGFFNPSIPGDWLVKMRWAA